MVVEVAQFWEACSESPNGDGDLWVRQICH
jgi:hypothetical protein